MLNKNEVKMLNDLANKEGFKCKKHLQHIIFFNTHESKYKVGDKVLFNEASHSYAGNQFINFMGEITKVERRFIEETYSYSIKVYIDCVNDDGSIKHDETTTWMREDSTKHYDRIIKKFRSDKNIVNKIYRKDKHDECLHL